MLVLKYTHTRSQNCQCPPVNYSQNKLKGYRFVFSEKKVADSFVPVAILEPYSNRANKCIAYGLSFFETANKAETFFNQLKSKVPMIHKKIGESLAVVMLNSDRNYGLVSPLNNKSGHFTVHELKDTEWRCSIEKRLCE